RCRASAVVDEAALLVLERAAARAGCVRRASGRHGPQSKRAEEEGFEPPVSLTPQRISSPPPSTARPLLRTPEYAGSARVGQGRSVTPRRSGFRAEPCASRR